MKIASQFQQSPRTLLWLVAIGFFMQTLDSTIVNTALPSIAKDLNESPLHMQWVLVSYMLTNAMIIPARVAGRPLAPAKYSQLPNCAVHHRSASALSPSFGWLAGAWCRGAVRHADAGGTALRYCAHSEKTGSSRP